MKFFNYLKEEYTDSVGLYIGRFSGLTKGHKAVIDIMASTHKEAYVLLVKGEQTSLDKNRNPFPVEVQKTMIEAILPSNVKCFIINNILNDLPEFTKFIHAKEFVIYAGPDRVDNYRGLLQYLKDSEPRKISVVNTEYMVPRDPNISGTKFREALRSGDISSFELVAPPELYNLFSWLRDYIS